MIKLRDLLLAFVIIVNNVNGAKMKNSMTRGAFAGRLCLPFLLPLATYADDETLLESDVERLQKGFDGLTDLLKHWNEKTTECFFSGDGKVCVRNSREVRDYLGFTSKDTPLFDVTSAMKKAASLVKQYDQETYLEAVETWQEALSYADSSTRAAFIKDVTIFDLSDEKMVEVSLKQSKGYIEMARFALLEILRILQSVRS
mmetsp:Transcript_14617/g.21746  ORF Transcript_14617/g.21746 Transcript_14617/m.21746 type:complete len:201 (-) Transcript_14617:67-669(-)